MMSVLERREQRALEKGLAAGIKEGREEGIKEGTEKTARNLLTMGIDLETIAKGTGLSLERVKEIQAELNGKANS